MKNCGTCGYAPCRGKGSSSKRVPGSWSPNLTTNSDSKVSVMDSDPEDQPCPALIADLGPPDEAGQAPCDTEAAPSDAPSAADKPLREKPGELDDLWAEIGGIYGEITYLEELEEETATRLELAMGELDTVKIVCDSVEQRLSELNEQVVADQNRSDGMVDAETQTAEETSTHNAPPKAVQVDREVQVTLDYTVAAKQEIVQALDNLLETISALQKEVEVLEKKKKYWELDILLKAYRDMQKEVEVLKKEMKKQGEKLADLTKRVNALEAAAIWRQAFESSPTLVQGESEVVDTPPSPSVTVAATPAEADDSVLSPKRQRF